MASLQKVAWEFTKAFFTLFMIGYVLSVIAGQANKYLEVVPLLGKDLINLNNFIGSWVAPYVMIIWMFIVIAFIWYVGIDWINETLATIGIHVRLQNMITGLWNWTIRLMTRRRL